MAYGWNPRTGNYIGEIPRQPSPLEPGVFLMPGYSTEKEPPECAADEIQHWTGTEWEIVKIPIAPEPPIPEPVPIDIIVKTAIIDELPAILYDLRKELSFAIWGQRLMEEIAKIADEAERGAGG